MNLLRLLTDETGKPFECSQPHRWVLVIEEWQCENCYQRMSYRNKREKPDGRR